MPFEIRGDYRPIELQELELQKQQPVRPSQSFLGIIGDSYALGWAGQVKDGIENIIARNGYRGPRDINFDPLDNVPVGYEQYADDFAWAWNQDEVDQIRANIDENSAIRRRRDQAGWGWVLGADLIAGVFDPVNLIPVPALKGIGFVKSALKGGVAVGGINAGTELLRHSLDPTSSAEETAFNIGMGFAIGGLISGGIGHFTRGRVDPAPSELPPKLQSEIEELSQRYTDTHNAVEGLTEAEVRSIIEKGGDTKIVFGAGKTNANGRYVPAFFRPKEAFEAAAAREAQQRAVDSALGDIIPDEAPLVRAIDEEVSAVEQPNQLEIDPATGEVRAAPEIAAKTVDEPVDTIFVDDAYIINSFDEKPWTVPKVAGVDPLPENAFANPHEWLLFNILHERNHVRNKRKPDETKGAYESRINTLAYDELTAARSTLAPTRRNVLEKLSIYPLPSASLARLAPDNRAVHELANGISGDMDTTKAANLLLGATTPGGSVFMRAQRKMLVNYEFAVEWQKAYVQYIAGTSSTSLFANTSNAFKAMRYGAPLIGKASRERKLSPREFREYVSRAIDMDGQAFEMHGKPLSDADMKLVNRVARAHDRIMERFGKEAQGIGLFDYQRRMQGEIEWREQHNLRDTERLAKLSKGGQLYNSIKDGLDNRIAELDKLKADFEAMQGNPVMPKGETRYRHRLYNISKIRDDYDNFVALISKAFAKDGSQNPDASAKRWVDNLIGNGGVDDREFGNIGRPNSLKSRTIPLTNAELAGYLVDDAALVLNIYSRRMGAAIEMFKEYGSLNLDKQISDLRAQLQDQGMSPKKIEEIVLDLGDLRDRAMGNFIRKDPLAWDSRTTRNIKNWVNMSLMGRGLFSQITDIARTVSLNGFEPLFKALEKAVDLEFSDLRRGVYAKPAGEAMELVNNQLAMQALEHEDAVMVTTQTGFERALSGGAQLMYQVNMMNPFTVVWKNFTSTMSAHMILDQAQTVAKALQEGRTLKTLTKPELKQAQFLASFGINPRDAQLLASMPIERTGTNGLIVANVENWTGVDGERARDLFLGALQGNIRSSVITPGPLQRPAWMDGVFRIGGKRIEQPLLSLPFSLLGFTMSSSAKLTHSMLSGRDRQMAVTMGALLTAGYIGSWLRAGDNWDRMDWKEKSLASLNASGVFGWLGEVVKRAEDLTGVTAEATGMTDLGADTVSDEVSAVAGPGASLIAGIVEAFVNPDLEDRQRAYLIRRTIPFNNLLWWNDYMKELSNWAASAGMLDIADNYDAVLDEEEVFMESIPAE